MRSSLIAATLFLASCASALNPLREKLEHALEELRSHETKGDISRRDSSTSELADSTINLVGIDVGTPPQSFKAIVDTGSYDAFLKAKECLDTGCVKDTTYDGSKSSTFTTTTGPSVTLAYADGTAVTGVASRDTTTVGGVTMSNFTFLRVLSYKQASTNVITYTAMLGMGMPSSNATAGTPGRLSGSSLGRSVTGQLSDAGIKPIFGLYPTLDGKPGLLTLGGIDTTKFSGDLTWVDVPTFANSSAIDPVMAAGTAGMWKAVMGAVKYPDGTENQVAGLPIILDTGSSLSLFPQSFVTKLGQSIGGTLLAQAGASGLQIYKVSCDKIKTLQDLTLTLGGKTVSIPPSIYIQNSFIRGETGCVLGFVSLGTEGALGGAALMGMNILRAFYTAWNWGDRQVGFARLAAPATPSGQPRSGTGSQGNTGYSLPALPMKASLAVALGVWLLQSVLV
ncbi:uncharacterized protein SPPG_04035 [Spizellomyces punctatus DAOM BR117]|uniref:Peptidase A1 domain-containing protein n=1 Tax=Spizellomyces punctatus (strain DAOM BR117) TaxID=645134 RepID=A0A0L0HJC0_SPIPD|nr:uncharacterized protein SPPG_04035 [Spizellomyces punctatus DAOM BR117]KND00934.1 hypothetical protein SPPG_04035 [Spizellomyces punctatus DAOM BR117]|eukprot:XP_016608973.1 hypothetical protein SPPG_04035 [Spizellomyces punctatus DAOM BR117]